MLLQTEEWRHGGRSAANVFFVDEHVEQRGLKSILNDYKDAEKRFFSGGGKNAAIQMTKVYNKLEMIK